MQKEMAVVALGVWLIILPFLGIPHSSSFFTALVALTGVGVLVAGLLLRSEVIAKGQRHSPHNSFVEHIPHQQPDHAARVSLDFTDEGKEGINSLN